MKEEEVANNRAGILESGVLENSWIRQESETG